MLSTGRQRDNGWSRKHLFHSTIKTSQCLHCPFDLFGPRAIALYSLVAKHFVSCFFLHIWTPLHPIWNGRFLRMKCEFERKDGEWDSVQKKNGFLMFNELVALGILLYLHLISWWSANRPVSSTFTTNELIETHNCFHFEHSPKHKREWKKCQNV